MGTVILATLAGSSMAFMIGATVEHQETLVQLNTMTTVPLFLLSGFFSNSLNYAPYLKPAEYLSTFKYCFQALVQTIFTDNSPFNCQNTTPSTCEPLANRFLFNEWFYHNLIALGSLIIFFKIMGFIFLYCFAKIKV